MTERARRLRWQCRRGMRELDEILGRFLAQRFTQLSSAEQDRFEQLLAREDQLLAGWFFAGQQPVEKEMQALVERIRDSRPEVDQL